MYVYVYIYIYISADPGRQKGGARKGLKDQGLEGVSWSTCLVRIWLDAAIIKLDANNAKV